MLQESFTGQGLYPGEAYAPNAPALVEAAAKAPGDASSPCLEPN
jgi:hypothetical protein